MSTFRVDDDLDGTCIDGLPGHDIAGGKNSGQAHQGDDLAAIIHDFAVANVFDESSRESFEPRNDR